MDLESQYECASPQPKRHCMEVNWIDSASSSDSSDDGPIFVSDTVSDVSDGEESDSSSSGAVFPSDSESISPIPAPEVNEQPPIVFDTDSASQTNEQPSVSKTTGSEDSAELEDVGKTLVSKCSCEHNCLRHLSAHDLLSARRKFRALGVTEQRQWLTDKVNESSRITELQTIETKFVIAGRNVCEFAWCKAHGVSEKRIGRVKKSVKEGQVFVEHGNKGVRRPSVRAETAKAWMTRYFHLVGDKMPHNSQIHLPSWETQKDVFFAVQGRHGTAEHTFKLDRGAEYVLSYLE